VPWSTENIHSYEELFDLVVKSKKRPTIPNVQYDNISIYLLNIMKECWNHEIKDRPTINDILKAMESNLNNLEYFLFIIHSDIENFEKNFIWDSKKEPLNDEKIWKLEEVMDNPLSIQNLSSNIEENYNEYNLIELNDLENEPSINE
jgi:hypothetical protein